jgi:penicillin amidase
MRRIVKRAAIVLLIGLGLGAAGVYGLLTGSLPRRDGSAALPGLTDPVRIELDIHAVPRIRGDSIADVFRAEGFMHAQQRYFEMDLTRRSAAGELAALVGARALPLDRRQRVFGFRQRAESLLAGLPAAQRGWLEAYAAGVNAGLADLGARPPEYWLLGGKPQPWTAADSVLVAYAIYTMLSNNEYYERAQAVMAASLPPEVYDFLTPSSTRYDRPLLTAAGDVTGGYRPAVVPPPTVIDLSRRQPVELPGGVVDPPLMGQAASNQWASAAARGVRGQAMIANDPHLEIRLPNLFYRAELYWPGGLARGVSIPGLPGILIGANAHLAWGATVSYIDQSDWVEIDVDPADPGRYLTPEGSEAFRVEQATVDVAGGEPQIVESRWTRWGPVLATDGLGRPLALKAGWLEPDGLNLDVLELATASTLDEALGVIGGWSGPSLSWAVAADNGEIAWISNGPIPRRVGFDGSRPTSWANGMRGWQGFREPPTTRQAANGVLFHANNRPLALPDADRLSRMWMRSHRVFRIAELLEHGDRFDEQDFFRMQLDTRAIAYDPYRDLILEIVPPTETDPELAEARRLVEDWNGRADADEAGFRILQIYYRALLERVLGPLLAPAYAADPAFVYRWPLADEPLLRLLEERPAHLLAPGFADWPALLRDVLRRALAAVEQDSRFGLDAPWGEVNRLAVGHPLAGLPLIGRWLRLPADAQPGSAVSIRVATPQRGAVFRMDVSPAEPEAGILQMAGGQSGHFLSPNFRDLHRDWVEDRPTPFLAGETASAFELLP